MAESREHYLLKQAAMLWLKFRGKCQAVATEVAGMGGNSTADTALETRWLYDWKTNRYVNKRVKRQRDVADVVGVRWDYMYRMSGTEYVYTYKFTTRLVEVKVSRPDFLNGYCTGANYAYVITPPGMVTPDELVDGVGLLEVDPEEIKPVRWYGDLLSKIKLVRRPKRQNLSDDHGLHTLIGVAARMTNEMIYKNPDLFEKKEA